MKGGIYAITGPTGDQYIGSSSNFCIRWKKHRNQLKLGTHHNAPLQEAWIKYGEESFVFSILLICAKNDLAFFETRAIHFYRPSYNIYGLPGGSRETVALLKARMKISRAQSGNGNPMFGRRGILAPMFGRRHSDESKRLMSMKLKGKPRSAEHREAMSRSRMGKYAGAESPSAKPVICIELGIRFDTGTLAKEWLVSIGKTKASQSAISAACIGKYKSAYGFHWRYADVP